MGVTHDSAATAAVFDAAVVALNAGDFAAAVRLCDPVSLQMVGRHLLETVGGMVGPPPLTVEEMQRLAPDMPREVAEYHVVEARRRVSESGILGELLPTCPSLAAAQAASPGVLFAWWLEAPLRRALGRRRATRRRAEARGGA